MAQTEAAIPIKAIMLFPPNGFLKSSRVILKMINPNAKDINTLVKIFIKLYFVFTKTNLFL